MGWIRLGDRRVATEELDTRARKAAAGLASLGVKPGDTVAVYSRNGIAFIEASSAAGIVGAYSVPVNWHYLEAEARYIFEDCGARVIVIHADLLRGVQGALPDQTTVLVVPTPDEIRAAHGLACDECAMPDGMTGWSEWLESFEPYDGPELPSLGTIIYTSRTTGRPKGVRRPPPDEAQAAAGAWMAEIGFGFVEPNANVTVVTGPMYHSAPNAYGLVAARIGGSVILQTKFDAERVTHLHMVPIMFSRLLKLPPEVRSRYDLSSLKFVVHAAAPCPPPVKREMIDWWGPVIKEYYGSTETGIVTFCTSEEWLARPGTVGREVGGAIVRIVDKEGKELPRGEVGEIVSINPHTPDFTYHGDDAKRRASDVNGLIAPGDVGYLDQDGFLFICDRAKDMIISGGVTFIRLRSRANCTRRQALPIVRYSAFPTRSSERASARRSSLPNAQSLTRTRSRIPARTPRCLQASAPIPDPGRTAARGFGQGVQTQAARAILGAGAEHLTAATVTECSHGMTKSSRDPRPLKQFCNVPFDRHVQTMLSGRTSLKGP